jgi:hypothetical protein
MPRGRPPNGVAPVLETSNCDGNSVTQTVTLARGTPYPLTMGGKWQYSFSGKDARGNQWSGQRHCAVEGTSRVKTTCSRSVIGCGTGAAPRLLS